MRAVIFANGTMESWPDGLQRPLTDDLVIAADGGLDRCLAWKITPDVVVGDLDSADPALVTRMQRRGVEIIRHPPRKDETDLELAFKLALERKIRTIVVLAALGARWDMTLSNVMILAAPYLTQAQVTLLDGSLEMMCLRGGRSMEITGRPGDRVSIIPLAGAAHGVILQGLEYPLNMATLPPGATRGLSNTLVNSTAEIRLDKGCLLVVLSHTR